MGPPDDACRALLRIESDQMRGETVIAGWSYRMHVKAVEWSWRQDIARAFAIQSNATQREELPRVGRCRMLLGHAAEPVDGAQPLRSLPRGCHGKERKRWYKEQ